MGLFSFLWNSALLIVISKLTIKWMKRKYGADALKSTLSTVFHGVVIDLPFFQYNTLRSRSATHARGTSLFNNPQQQQTVLEPVATPDGGYMFELDVPGFTRNELTLVHLDSTQVLWITGKKGGEDATSSSWKRARSVDVKLCVPVDADVSTVQAKMENGVLAVELRKLDTASGKGRSIRID
ncbi:hypothetical protein BJ741DRAFT_644341 [Chytriomyces cf. hyalinus JEL632]|nr:hypothetical protein BJ741DRAFT_644341 [Chytriomyces cf. hyalinus JEL632]